MSTKDFMQDATYLGDAVYAKVDNYGAVVLATSDGVSWSERIVLEPETLVNLLVYLRSKGFQV